MFVSCGLSCSGFAGPRARCRAFGVGLWARRRARQPPRPLCLPPAWPPLRRSAAQLLSSAACLLLYVSRILLAAPDGAAGARLQNWAGNLEPGAGFFLGLKLLSPPEQVPSHLVNWGYIPGRILDVSVCVVLHSLNAPVGAEASQWLQFMFHSYCTFVARFPYVPYVLGDAKGVVVWQCRSRESVHASPTQPLC